MPHLRVLGIGDHTTERPSHAEQQAVAAALDHQRTDTELGRLVSAVGARALAGAALPSLRELDLTSTALYDAGIAEILGAGWFAQLEALYLADTGCTDATYRQLRRHLATGRLAVLDVSDNPGVTSG